MWRIEKLSLSTHACEHVGVKQPCNPEMLMLKERGLKWLLKNKTVFILIRALNIATSDMKRWLSQRVHRYLPWVGNWELPAL